MNLKEDKLVMIEIDWANNYTDYLKGLILKIRPIEN
jgi:hypothetical protein